MFIGQYAHTLEEKGRLQIPKDFREALRGGTVITKGLDNCLFLFPKEKWEILVQKLSSLPLTKTDARAFSRLLTYGASEVYTDQVGRILIPQYLREYAHIKDAVIIAGNLDKIEIWDKEIFDKYEQRIEKDSDEIAENLKEIGF